MLLPRFIRRLLWKSVLYLGVPALLGIGGYAFYASKSLAGMLAPAGVTKYTTHWAIAKPGESSVGTSLPAVLRVRVKRTDAPNFLPSSAGLIYATYDWSPSNSVWVEVPPTSDDLSVGLRLKGYEFKLPGDLIVALDDPQPLVREVAHSILVLRTGQDFGFRPDASATARAEAVGKWRAWWAENKLGWYSGKILDGVEALKGRGTKEPAAGKP